MNASQHSFSCLCFCMAPLPPSLPLCIDNTTHCRPIFLPLDALLPRCLLVSPPPIFLNSSTTIYEANLFLCTAPPIPQSQSQPSITAPRPPAPLPRLDLSSPCSLSPPLAEKESSPPSLTSASPSRTPPLLAATHPPLPRLRTPPLSAAAPSFRLGTPPLSAATPPVCLLLQLSRNMRLSSLPPPLSPPPFGPGLLSACCLSL